MKELADSEVYSDAVLQRFANPPGAGWLDAPDHEGCARSSVRNAEVCFAVRLEGSMVSEARFRARGCPHTLALASLACEALEGRDFAALQEFDAADLAESLPLPANKLDLKLLVEDAVRAVAHAEHG